MINGKLINNIRIERGLRQGYPLSRLRFILSNIRLFEVIKDSTRIEGNTTKRNSKIKVQRYADDNTVFISIRQSTLT